MRSDRRLQGGPTRSACTQPQHRAKPEDLGELVYELLGRTEGKFEFRNMVVDSADEIRNPTALLLLEGARLIDEARRK